MAIWDVPHRRGAGFTLQVLHAGITYPVMALLHERPRMHPVEVARALAPGSPDAFATSHLLPTLRRCGLVRHGPGQSEPGVHAVYELTGLGAGMIGSLGPLGDWAADRFGTHDRTAATAAAIALFDRRFAFTLMCAVHAAGRRGIEPGRAEESVNALMDSQPEPARYRLRPSTRHPALNHLRDAELLRRRAAPAAGRPSRVLYSATGSGRALMDALWPVAEWALPHDGHLSACVGLMTSWWDPPERADDVEI
jgi:DNA-binding HxlR family transcriptional regulator